jgi:serine/threonine-protein kinase RIO1
MNSEESFNSKRARLLQEPFFTTGYPLTESQIRYTPEFLKQMYESTRLQEDLNDKRHIVEMISMEERGRIDRLIGNLKSRYEARHQKNFNGHEPETSLHRYKTEIEGYKLILEYLEKMEI